MLFRVVVVLLALVLDLAAGDPPNRFHPVATMGRWLSWGRSLAPSQNRLWFGTGWTLMGMALFALPWWLVKERVGMRFTNKATRLLGSALLLKAVFAYRNLRRAVVEVGEALAEHDLSRARRLAAWHLVSRDTGQLSEAEVAGAAIESLAENLTDSMTAPLLAYVAGGLPAAWAYRFVNTADAMWGYRNPEFEQLGKFSARLDDVLNWIPARLTGWLLVAAAWLAGADPEGARRTMLSQHNQVTSLNAGWTMSAMAGALGLTLSKRGVYELVGGPQMPDIAAIQWALRISAAALGLGACIILVGGIVQDRLMDSKLRPR